MVTLIPDHQVKFSLFVSFDPNQTSKLGPQKMVMDAKKFSPTILQLSKYVAS